MISRYDFSRVTTLEALLLLLGLDGDLFENVIKFKPESGINNKTSGNSILTAGVKLFYRHTIPKKNKKHGHRTVWEPLLIMSNYKSLSRKFDAFFRYHLPGYPHPNAFGFRPGRNIRENAQVHVGNARILSLDIDSFFPSITKERVETLFRGMGLNALVSDLLSRFVTINGELASGFPTSPVISNAIALPIDLELSELAAKFCAQYSRYADDITFSGNGELPDLGCIESCLNKRGFQIKHDKTRWSKRGQSHYVTGLSVSDPVQPHVPRGRKRTLRQQLYYMKKFGINDHFKWLGIHSPIWVQQKVNSIDGMVKWVAHHEPRTAAKLKSRWNEVLRAEGWKPSFEPKRQNREPFYIFVDEAEFKRADTAILALAMAASQHADRIIQETRDVFEEEIQDLWAAGDIQNLMKRGLHFVDATEDLRHNYVKRLAAMPFEGYVTFCSYTAPSEYESAYLKILQSMVARRLMAAESQFV